VIHGSVQVSLEGARALEVTESGRFTEGRAEVEEAEISGLYEGELTVRGRLLVRSTGRVSGIVRYGEVQVERGGKLTGTVSVLDDKMAAQSTMAESQQQG
jgi:cytoskeletal protein CcmA (bactofilin family)